LQSTLSLSCQSLQAACELISPLISWQTRSEISKSPPNEKRNIPIIWSFSMHWTDFEICSTQQHSMKRNQISVKPFGGQEPVWHHWRTFWRLGLS